VSGKNNMQNPFKNINRYAPTVYKYGQSAYPNSDFDEYMVVRTNDVYDILVRDNTKLPRPNIVIVTPRNDDGKYPITAVDLSSQGIDLNDGGRSMQSFGYQVRKAGEVVVGVFLMAIAKLVKRKKWAFLPSDETDSLCLSGMTIDGRRNMSAIFVAEDTYGYSRPLEKPKFHKSTEKGLSPDMVLERFFVGYFQRCEEEYGDIQKQKTTN